MTILKTIKRALIVAFIVLLIPIGVLYAILGMSIFGFIWEFIKMIIWVFVQIISGVFNLIF